LGPRVFIVISYVWPSRGLGHLIKDWSLPRMMAHGICLKEREFL